MVGVKSVFTSIGVDTTSSVSILGHLFGFSRASVPTDPDPSVTAQVSMLAQVRALQGTHIHLNVIRVGFDSFASPDLDDALEKLDYAVYKIRNIYSPVNLGVGRVEHHEIIVADASGFDDLASEDEADQLSDEFTIENDGIDVFVVRNVSDTDFVGISPINGSCEKPSQRDGLVGGEINRGFDAVARTFAHEIGHFLGLQHNHGSNCPDTAAGCDNLMAQTRCATSCGSGVRTATVLTSDQGETMSSHCSTQSGDQVIAMGDQEAVPEILGEEELREALVGRHPSLPTTTAAKELIRRGMVRGTEMLTDILADESQSQETRTIAAVELGKAVSAEHQAALVSALGTENRPVIRRAAEGLGRIGDETALHALEAIPPSGHDPAARSIAFARTLISYRLGLGSHRLERPPSEMLLHVEADQAVPLKIENLDPALLKTAAEVLRRELPAMSVSERGAVKLVCNQTEFFLVFNNEMHALDSLQSFAQRDAIPAVILKKAESLESVYLHEYVMMNRREGEVALLFGMRSTGVPYHFGELRLRGERGRFWLRAINAPYSNAMDIEGEYDHENHRVTWAKALVSSGFVAGQRRPARPKKVEIPIK